MANALKKTKIDRDRFTDDGVRLFNPTKEHGTVYSDGFIEVKFIQEYEGRGIHYRGDGTPVGYKAGAPLPKHADELLTENEQLQNKVKDLESAQARTNELLARLMAKLEERDKDPGPQPGGEDMMDSIDGPQPTLKATPSAPGGGRTAKK